MSAPRRRPFEWEFHVAASVSDFLSCLWPLSFPDRLQNPVSVPAEVLSLNCGYFDRLLYVW